MKYYRIREWDKNFENNRTRELKKLDWVKVPNKHDGYGFAELLDHPNGMAHYGAWMLILQVASKCETRGTLLRSGVGGKAVAHTPQSIARISHGNAAVMEEAMERLVTIGWIEVCEESAPDCGIPAPKAGTPPSTEGNEGNEGKGHIAPDPHKPVKTETLRTIEGARDFVKRHPAFANIPDAAIENVFKPYEPFRDHWPKMVRQFQTDHAGEDKMKYPPCQQLRIDFDRFIKFNNITPGYVQK